MARKFHEEEFDDATLLKLAIFRGYIREWLPVFLTKRNRGSGPKEVNLFDFFSGPGEDGKGNPGSPLIIQAELRAYCQRYGNLKAAGIQVRLNFSDKDREKTEQLRRCLAENACPRDCCETIAATMLFRDALTKHLPAMRAPQVANLVIMDQCGLSKVTPDVVNELAQCGTTDILFFISSNHIRRFRNGPAIRKYFQMDSEELGKSEYKWIHRHICQYFRSKLSTGMEYHLAPFSIKKGGNIHGVIFGSGSLLGLEKFLKVCWDLDRVTGEANYDIDDDPIRCGDDILFPEMRIPKKEDVFHRELEEMLAGGDDDAPISNLDVYRFTLEKGFLPKQANAHLKELRKKGRLDVIDPGSGNLAGKRAFYLTWKNYKTKTIRAVFRKKD